MTNSAVMMFIFYQSLC